MNGKLIVRPECMAIAIPARGAEAARVFEEYQILPLYLAAQIFLVSEIRRFYYFSEVFEKISC